MGSKDIEHSFWLGFSQISFDKLLHFVEAVGKKEKFVESQKVSSVVVKKCRAATLLNVVMHEPTT